MVIEILMAFLIIVILILIFSFVKNFFGAIMKGSLILVAIILIFSLIIGLDLRNHAVDVKEIYVLHEDNLTIKSGVLLKFDDAIILGEDELEKFYLGNSTCPKSEKLILIIKNKSLNSDLSELSFKDVPSLVKNNNVTVCPEIVSVELLNKFFN